MLEALVSYLVVAMVAWCPLKDHRYTKVTDGQTEQRYTSLATNIAVVALDEREDPLFSGATGRAQTALLMAAVASYESGGFRADVDNDHGTGDGKTAHCLMQVHQNTQGALDCFRKSLVWLRSSMKDCKHLPLRDRLAEYASGQCALGHGASEKRYDRAMTWWYSTPFGPPPEALAFPVRGE